MSLSNILCISVYFISVLRESKVVCLQDLFVQDIIIDDILETDHVLPLMSVQARKDCSELVPTGHLTMTLPPSPLANRADSIWLGTQTTHFKRVQSTVLAPPTPSQRHCFYCTSGTVPQELPLSPCISLPPHAAELCLEGRFQPLKLGKGFKVAYLLCGWVLSLIYQIK